MKYKELLELYRKGDKIQYKELLLTQDWYNKRAEIIERDNYQCTKCGSTKSVNYYRKNIAIDRKDYVLRNSIIKNQGKFEDLRKSLGFNDCTFVVIENEISFCITNKGDLFLSYFNSDRVKDENELNVEKCKTKKGKDFYILTEKNIKTSYSKLYIPHICEKPKNIQVHHNFYVYEFLPWEYENHTMTTLCNLCHWNLHKKTDVPIYTNQNGELEPLNFTPCTRCNGAGVFPEYRRIENGICFRCDGNRYEELINKISISKFIDINEE
jgi:hypothetical protein